MRQGGKPQAPFGPKKGLEQLRHFRADLVKAARLGFFKWILPNTSAIDSTRFWSIFGKGITQDSFDFGTSTFTWFTRLNSVLWYDEINP